jgi:hypothetical protein
MGINTGPQSRHQFGMQAFVLRIQISLCLI